MTNKALQELKDTMPPTLAKAFDALISHMATDLKNGDQWHGARQIMEIVRTVLRAMMDDLSPAEYKANMQLLKLTSLLAAILASLDAAWDEWREAHDPDLQ